jgi:hemolysin activation/secretion protein
MLCGALAACAVGAVAPEPLGAQPFDRPAQERLEVPEPESPEEARPPILPPPPLAEPGPAFPLGPRFRPRGFRIEGSTVFTADDFRPLLEPYLDREIASEDLGALRNAVTRLYVERGYVNSGAFIPDQDLEEGLIRIRIVEGALINIEVVGERRFRESRLRDRVALGAGTPLNVYVLQEALQILQQDPRIERVDARLQPGERPGEAVLTVRVEESRPYHLELEASNYAPPSFGGYQGQFTLAHDNVVGFGDRLGGRFRVAWGLFRFDGGYELPITARGTLLRVGGEYSDSEIVEEPFSVLDVQTGYEAVRIAVEQPVYRTIRTSVRLGLIGEWRRVETKLCAFERLLGQCDPFAVPGSGADPDDGRTTVSVLRLSGELVHRDRRQVIAARSLLSIGLPVLGASTRDIPPSEVGVTGLRNPDGEFVAWLGQIQWVRRFDPWGIQTILRADAQLSSDALPSLERFPVGGHLSVRGYRENQIVRDQGVVVSLQSRIPIWSGERLPGSVGLAPFVDWGYAKNRRNPSAHPRHLLSVGVELYLAVTRFADAVLTWGHPLENVRSSGDIQDDGIQFRATFRGF